VAKVSALGRGPYKVRSCVKCSVVQCEHRTGIYVIDADKNIVCEVCSTPYPSTGLGGMATAEAVAAALNKAMKKKKKE